MSAELKQNRSPWLLEILPRCCCGFSRESEDLIMVKTPDSNRMSIEQCQLIKTALCIADFALHR